MPDISTGVPGGVTPTPAFSVHFDQAGSLVVNSGGGAAAVYIFDSAGRELCSFMTREQVERIELPEIGRVDQVDVQ